MSDSPYENTRSRKKKGTDGATESTDVAPAMETADKPTDLQNIMKAGREAKAKQEEEMTKALDSLVISPRARGELPQLKYDTKSPSESGKRVGLVFDCRMLKHKASRTIDYGRKHPERPERISRPIEKLYGSEIFDRLYLIEGREATQDEISTVHLKGHISDMASTEELETAVDFEIKQNMYDSIYLCQDSYMCALVSCGSTLSIVEKVVNGSLQSGFALVRPPGHHAEAHTACGFCLFNNVAVAARHAQKFAKKQGIVENEEDYKILILDWDVHHGNGTQNMFYSDPSILYISLHRYDNGIFFPSSEAANYDKIGSEKGTGFNINIPWSGARMGNSEYYTAFERIVMPIAEEFNPNLVLVSSGFDAGKGDPLGGYYVTPNMYGYMTNRLQSLASGKVVIVLEGGYSLTTVSDSVYACVESLLEVSEKHTSIENSHDGDAIHKMLKYEIPPRLKAVNTAGLTCIFETLDCISLHWSCVKSNRDKIDDMLQERKQAAAEKLLSGVESLEPAATSPPDGDKQSEKRHSYGTRANVKSTNQSRTSTPNTASKKATDSSSETLQTQNNYQTRDEIFLTPTGETTSSAIENSSEKGAFDMGSLESALPDLASTTNENDQSSSDTSSYYSAHSPLPNVGETPAEKGAKFISATSPQMDGSYLDDFLSDKEKSSVRENKQAQGACAADIEIKTSERKEVELVLSAMGFTETQDMSLEDMVAIAQATLPEHASGYTVPKENCPHISDYASREVIAKLNVDTFCHMCEYVIENWTCLHCSMVFCGRFVNAHMLDHYNETGHAVVLSHSDLSFWCYKCDAYLNNYTNEVLRDIYREAHILKHRVDLPS